MTNEAFKFLQELTHLGIDIDCISFYEDVDSAREMFRTKYEYRFPGKWVFAYVKKDDHSYLFLKTASTGFQLEDDDDYILEGCPLEGQDCYLHLDL